MLAIKKESFATTQPTNASIRAKEPVSGAGTYAGEVTAEEAWESLSVLPAATLIDVRTPPEWTFAGIPDISSLHKEVVAISWKIYPTYVQNEQFITQLQGRIPSKDTPLFFICRTGGRSLDAAVAATAAGYKCAFNVTDGFEGPLSDTQHRGELRGWKATTLPWMQG